MKPTQTPAAFAAGYSRPHIYGGGREEKERRPDRNRDSDWDKATRKTLTRSGHFRKP